MDANVSPVEHLWGVKLHELSHLLSCGFRPGTCLRPQLSRARDWCCSHDGIAQDSATTVDTTYNLSFRLGGDSVPEGSTVDYQVLAGALQRM